MKTRSSKAEGRRGWQMKPTHTPQIEPEKDRHESAEEKGVEQRVVHSSRAKLSLWSDDAPDTAEILVSFKIRRE